MLLVTVSEAYKLSLVFALTNIQLISATCLPICVHLIESIQRGHCSDQKFQVHSFHLYEGSFILKVTLQHLSIGTRQKIMTTANLSNASTMAVVHNFSMLACQFDDCEDDSEEYLSVDAEEGLDSPEGRLEGVCSSAGVWPYLQYLKISDHSWLRNLKVSCVLS